MKEVVKIKILNWDFLKGFVLWGFGRKFKGAVGMDGSKMGGFGFKMRGFWLN